MNSLYILLIIAVFIIGSIRYLLWDIGYYYKGEEGYELENEQEENKSHQNKEARSVKSENINRM